MDYSVAGLFYYGLVVLAMLAKQPVLPAFFDLPVGPDSRRDPIRNDVQDAVNFARCLERVLKFKLAQHERKRKRSAVFVHLHQIVLCQSQVFANKDPTSSIPDAAELAEKRLRRFLIQFVSLTCISKHPPKRGYAILGRDEWMPSPPGAVDFP